MDAEAFNGMVIQTAAGSQTFVETLSYYKYEVHTIYQKREKELTED